MPKQTLKIEGFHGGLNTNADPRDVGDLQSPDSLDVGIDSLGKIKLLGTSAAVDTSNSLIILPNRGLFVMDADRKVSNNLLSDTTLIIVYDTDDSEFDIYDTSWSTGEISLQTSHPVFYIADGILRIADGSLTYDGKWYGYISTRKFNGLNADSTAINDWISSNQNIVSPSSGVCLISDPTVGADGDTVNSSNSEYDGNIADGSGHEPLVHSAVNLRVGVQKTEVFENDSTAWSRNVNSPFNTTNFSEPAETEIFPPLGNNVFKFEGNTGILNYIILNNADSGTTLSFTISEEQCILFCVNISETELDKLDYFSLILSSGTGNLEWKFFSDDLVPDCWNFLVANKTNFSNETDGTDIDSTFTSMEIQARQKFGGSYGTANSSNHSADYYLSTPVLAINPSLEGFQPGVYTFHHTYLYDDVKQESKPTEFSGASPYNYEPNKVNIVGGSLLFNFDAYILSHNNAGTPAYSFNKRIVGSRLYYKVEENDNYFLIGELDFIEKGFKFFPESDTLAYSMIDSSHASDLLAKAALIKGISPDSANTIDTFKTINGFDTEVKSLNARYKTAVVHGRRAYIGNIEKDGEEHSDRMLKSRVNKFDTFPSGMGVVDVAIRDGESIVKLEAFADRILQFKQKSLYVINVSESIDFLEDVYKNKGCAFDYHVTKTDYGISWFNKFGVYFFDGKNVINLLEKDGVRLIGESDWESFITSNDANMSEAHIGYIPKKRHLLIKNYDKDVFIYDFVLRAWTKGVGRIIIQRIANNSNNTNMTNFALDGDEDLIYITNDASSIATWNPSPDDSGNFLYTTKDIDFGQPSVRKKIYKVYVTYKSGGSDTNVMVDYDINGGTTFPYDFQDGTNFISNKLVAATGWQQAELKPDNSSGTNESNNVYSFRLRFQYNAASVPAGFEINDITIVYRLKNIK
jgi:hypothetical protein